MSELTYTIFGLTIRSPLEIPELTPAETESVDVDIKFGKNPTGLDDVRSSGILFEAAEISRCRPFYQRLAGGDIIVALHRNTLWQTCNIWNHRYSLEN